MPPPSPVSIPFELQGAPVHGFRGNAPDGPLTHPRGLTVAISRQAGSRGTEIAKKVADILTWQVFDHDTLDYLVQNDDARAQLLADVPADARAWADAQLEHLQRDHKLNADPEVLPLIRLVLTVAARGNAVIVGRAAGFLLPPETTVHVRVIAPTEARVAYLAQELRLTRPEAAEEVRARDERRALFLDRTLARDPADPTAYDAVVNAERLGVEGAAQFIGWAVRTKQMFAEIAESGPPSPFTDLDELAGV
ncbi:cytidylate kinase-like family protein [Gemmata sp. JC717]|uniref:cytidylate kinase-like family protein n=1 Tax=Gemmata algarum TaxID=2975278 RepID=UPI0021BB4248|nr:cytidylate kinase-like family protein [Gemmata algarum]MDY3554123.1 cytidylate kinase-like family protein [Gemmata algarum]